MAKIQYPAPVLNNPAIVVTRDVEGGNLSHVVKAADLTVAHDSYGPATLHTTGCTHLSRKRIHDTYHAGAATEFTVYADDYYDVAPCARKSL